MRRLAISDLHLASDALLGHPRHQDRSLSAVNYRRDVLPETLVPKTRQRRELDA
ncbi:hypothetical protein [Rhizobium sp.]|uniref:hypothetical protein n=1 Tax=Rhizobium sp. TaxID=391 RepID=UPI002F1988D6